MGAFGVWSLLYSFNFQTRQIPVINEDSSENSDPFSVKPTVAKVKISKKKKKKKRSQFFQFEISVSQASKQKGTYFFTRKIFQNFEGLTIGTVTTELFELLQFFKVHQIWPSQQLHVQS